MSWLLLGLGLALRRGLDAAGLPIGLADLLLGAAAARSVETDAIASAVAASLPPDASAQARAQLGPRIARAIHDSRAAAVASAFKEPPI